MRIDIVAFHASKGMCVGMMGGGGCGFSLFTSQPCTSQQPDRASVVNGEKAFKCFVARFEEEEEEEQQHDDNCVNKADASMSETKSPGSMPSRMVQLMSQVGIELKVGTVAARLARVDVTFSSWFWMFATVAMSRYSSKIRMVEAKDMMEKWNNRLLPPPLPPPLSPLLLPTPRIQ